MISKMELVNSLPSVRLINSETRFWMIRTKRGFFFDEFIQNKYVAIGWNLISKSMLLNNASNKNINKSLKDLIRDNYEEKKPGTALNKCIRFCHEIKNGDIGVVVGRQKVAFVYIGEYFEKSLDKFPLKLEKETNKQIEEAGVQDSFACPYTKCRKITVIKVIENDAYLSPYLEAAFARNWHSLSDLTDYANLILSTCYDTFCYKDHLTVTFRVSKKGDINAFDLASFILTSGNLLSNYSQENISIKTALHSPGDISLTAQIIDNLPYLLGFVYAAIFGGQYKGIVLNSIYSMYEKWKKAELIKQKEELELLKLQSSYRKENAEAKLIEQQAIEKKIENYKKLKQLGLHPVEQDLEKIAQTSQRLGISLSKETINDVKNMIQDEESLEAQIPSKDI